MELVTDRDQEESVETDMLEPMVGGTRVEEAKPECVEYLAEKRG